MSILIVGGTGTVGSEVVRRLAGRGDGVTVLTRSPEKSGKLPSGARGAVGDLEKPETLPAAFEGVDQVGLITPLHPEEAQLGRNAVDAARKAGVKRIVYLSIHDVEKCPEAPHFRSKIEIQKAIEKAGMSHVFVMPNNFFQNDYWFQQPMTEYGVYPQPIGDAGLSRVDTRDVAEAIAAAVTGDRYEGRYPVVGSEALTGTRTAAVWSRHLGRPVHYGGDDLDAWEQQQLQWGLPQWLVADFKIMYRFFQQKGLRASDADLARQEEILGHAPRRFEDFAGETASAWKRG
jgi:uncharacterized protein YbjT (DUF2867 family)